MMRFDPSRHALYVTPEGYDLIRALPRREPPSPLVMQVASPVGAPSDEQVRAALPELPEGDVAPLAEALRSGWPVAVILDEPEGE